MILIQVKNWLGGSLVPCMQMEAQTSLCRALEYIESFKPSFGLMMSLHEQDLHKNDLREKDPKKKGFVVCDPQATNRSDLIMEY